MVFSLAPRRSYLRGTLHFILLANPEMKAGGHVSYIPEGALDSSDPNYTLCMHRFRSGCLTPGSTMIHPCPLICSGIVEWPTLCLNSWC